MGKIKELFFAAKACCPLSRINVGKDAVDGVPRKDESSIRIMSFNLRCASDPDGSVYDRSKIATEIILKYAPDSFGVQEETPKWKRILSRRLRGKYVGVGVARDPFGPWTEYNCIYYLRDKYNLIDNGTFWLSETPEEKYSVSFDSQCRRIATWAVLEDKETGEKYTHINTHLDHVLESTRVSQSEVLLNEMSKLQTQGTVICTGDFNTYNDGEVYAAMTAKADDAASVAKNTDGGITFHDYGKITDETEGPIDFIFLTKGTKAETYKIIRNTVSGMYPSDHYPIIADIKLS